MELTIEQSGNYDWNRSISEPDLTDHTNLLNRFAIKHPHEYISVDDLKFFRRRKPPDTHTHSNIWLYNKDEPVLPFGARTSEYRRQFHVPLGSRSQLLRRATSLHLEGLMNHRSEQQEQFHWYSPEDCKSCRTFPIRNPENLRLGGDLHMDPEYRSSYIGYPMVDRTTKILPREMFRHESDAPPPINRQALERSPEEVAAINKLAADKFKRDLAAQEQHKCHLQERDARAQTKGPGASPSEYQRQFVQFPIEKAHSIPQIDHIQMRGDFVGVAVPEYSASFKMYDNYSKSAPIKKADNLLQSGAEGQASSTTTTTNTTAAGGGPEVPEYREKFRNPPRDAAKDKSQPLKTEDHLHPRGEFTKDVPEYYESFRDPQVKQMPERGKCREPYLRLKGKIEFNPEYRSTYLDFPRSRPIVKKSTSSFRLPTSSSNAGTAASAAKTTTTANDLKSPKRSPRRKYKSSSPNRYTDVGSVDLTATPEYRRAQYNYQLRERTPPRKIIESDGGGNSKLALAPASKARKSSDSSPEPTGKITSTNRRRPSRHRPVSILDQQPHSTQSSFENVGARRAPSHAQKPAKFGRRASVLQNADNCRENSSIIEGNPKYTLSTRYDKYNRENQQQDSFVVLDEPCKRTNWMKKSWYES